MTRLLLLGLAATLAAPSASAQRCNISRSGGITLPFRVTPGAQFSIGYGFISLGDGPCPEIEVGHYFSADQYFSPDDVLLGTTMLPPSQPQSNLPAGGDVAIPADTPRGGYFILAVADHLSQVPEISEGDNTMFGSFTVGGDSNGPNLIVATAMLEDVTAAPGDRVSFDYSVQNQGQTGTGDVNIGFYLVLRNSGQSPPPQIPLDTETIGGVDAGQTERENEQVTIPTNTPPGQYTFAVFADFGNSIEEFDEIDNRGSAGILTVTGNTADESEPSASALSLVASPNPAGASVRLSYALAEAQTVRVSVVDALGRTIAAIDGTRGAGVHTEALDTAAWAPGVYVARLAAGGETEALTITVAR